MILLFRKWRQDNAFHELNPRKGTETSLVAVFTRKRFYPAFHELNPRKGTETYPKGKYLNKSLTGTFHELNPRKGTETSCDRAKGSGYLALSTNLIPVRGLKHELYDRLTREDLNFPRT